MYVRSTCHERSSRSHHTSEPQQQQKDAFQTQHWHYLASCSATKSGKLRQRRKWTVLPEVLEAWLTLNCFLRMLQILQIRLLQFQALSASSNADESTRESRLLSHFRYKGAKTVSESASIGSMPARDDTFVTKGQLNDCFRKRYDWNRARAAG